MGNVLHRMTEEEVPGVMALLAASGGTARTEGSWKQDRMTALVLGEMTAVMPMSRRRIAVGPGRTAEVGWLSSNQFASRMGLRRQTKGTAGEWAGLLPELDALVVVKRDESSLAGRWYSQTGFCDVLSIRCLYLEMAQAPEGMSGAGRYQVQVVGTEMAAKWDAEMLGVYRDVYANYGGAVVRGEGFWGPVLAQHYYKEHYQFQVVGLWSGTSLMGYAVVGWSGWHSKRPRMDILELATRQWDTGVASELIRTTCQLAWSKGVKQVRAVVSAHDPYRGHLTRSGFVDRWGYQMLAKWLHPQRYVDGVAKALPEELEGFGVQVGVNGEVPVVMGSGKPGGNILQLQGDARAVTRLLLQRLDITSALQGTGEGTLFSAQGKVTEGEITRLSMVFPWTPWVFHMLDFI